MIKNLRILGIDPGFGRIGFGIIEKRQNDFQALSYGCIETSAQDPFIDRLEELHRVLCSIIKKYKPDRAAVEELFFYKNAKTAIKVGQARGVILLTLRQAGLTVDEFTPLQIKQSVVGYGRAEKFQVQKMLQIILKMKERPTQDDAADALAVAFTCSSFLKLNGIMKS